MTRQPLNHRRIATTQAIDDLFAQVQPPAPMPTNIIPFPAQELHVPAKINANGVFSIVSSNMAHHVAAIEDICGSVSDYTANVLRIRHDDPARGEVFEVAVRALINLAAEMVGASAYLVFSDSEPTNQDAPEVGQGQRAAVKVA